MDALLQDQLDLEKLLPALWNYFGGQLSRSQLVMVFDTRGSPSYVRLLNSLKILSLKNARIGSRATAARASGKSQKARST